MWLSLEMGDQVDSGSHFWVTYVGVQAGQASQQREVLQSEEEISPPFWDSFVLGQKANHKEST